MEIAGGIIIIATALTGHRYVALWLFAPLLCSICYAGLEHYRERSWWPAFLAQYHRTALTLVVVAVVVCTGLLHRAWSNSEIYEFLVPGNEPMPTWQPELILDHPSKEDADKIESFTDKCYAFGVVRELVDSV